MKLLVLTAACCGLLLAGCDSGLPDDVRSALGPRESPKSRVFPADQKATYAAAKATVEDMDFHIIKGGPNEGTMVAMNHVERGDEVGSARQISIRVTMQPGPESGTEVEVAMTEILQADADNPGGLATETPLHDTPLYDVFFKGIQARLNGPVAKP
jgi:hypothetical protein